MKLRKEIVIPVGIFVLAALVRLIGVRWGLPNASHWYSYHPDEHQIFVAVANLDFFQGKFNPHFFNYPSLFLYCVYVTHFLLSGFGVWTLNATDPGLIWQWPAQILLTARCWSAVLGAGTAVLVYAILREWRPHLSYLYALFGGLLLAIVPGHVQHSHFATVDVAAVFMLTLSLYLAMRVGNSSKPERTFLWSCLVAGLATSTKYNAGLIVLAPLCALFWEPRLRAKSKVLLPALLALLFLGFVIGTPYSVLNFNEFWGNGQNTGVAYELLVHPRQGQGDVFAATGNGWWYHLTYNLPFVLTWPLLLLSLLGIATLLRKPWLGSSRWIVLVFTLCFFASLGLSQVRFMRYVLPLVPPLMICAAFGLWQIKVLLGKKAAAVMAGVLVLVAFWGTANVLAAFVKPDPRTQSATWIKDQLESPTTVGMIDVPRFWSPPLVPLDVIFGSRLTLDDIEKTDPLQRFDFVITGLDGQKLAAQKPQWFVMSEFAWRDEARLRPRKFQKFMKVLQKEYQLQGIYQNHPWLALPGRDFVPHDYLYTNPEIRVYRRKVR